MALYFYETPATSVSMVGADGTTTVFAGPNLSLDEIPADTALNVLGASAVAHEPTFPDVALSVAGFALPGPDGFPDIKFPMEWEF